MNEWINEWIESMNNISYNVVDMKRNIRIQIQIKDLITVIINVFNWLWLHESIN